MCIRDRAQTVSAMLKDWGKAPVIVKRDLPGQLANRILQAVIREAVNIVEMGLASAEDVDTAVKMGMALRFPVWGPLEHVDAVGLDICGPVQDLSLIHISIYEVNADYVLYAKLMGLPDKKITGYVFRNAMLPQISGLALSLGTMVSGSLITEIVFNYPGIGYWLFTAIRQLDYPLISGCTLVISITVLVANFLLDVLYGLIDPRIKAAQVEEE